MAGDARLARGRARSGRAPSNAIQYRTLGRVTRVRAYLVRSPRLTGGRQAAPSWRARRRSSRAPAGTPTSRSAARRPYYADGIHLAIVHHTAGSNSYSKSQSASIVRAIELYHVQGNGWNDIGYNFLVDKYGQIFEGRYGGIDQAVVGAHAQGFNTGSVGIALIGDYTSTSITPAARAALVSLIAWRLDLGARRPALEGGARLGRQPALRGGHARSRCTRSRPTATSTRPAAPARASTRSCPRSRTEVAKTGLPKLYAPAVVGHARRAGPLHRAALERRAPGR